MGTSGSYFNTAQGLNAGVYVYSTVGSFVNSGVLAGGFNVSVYIYGTSFPVYSGNMGQFGDGTEKFVGVAFDISGNTHYGWLRFKDVAADGSAWTLVDMAYDDQADTGIKTAQTGGGLVSIIDNDRANVDVFSNGNDLIVNVDESMAQSNIEVYDLSGKVVLSERINGLNNRISINLPSNVYVVRLFNNEKAISRKIKL